jgi:hypothetical protein
LLINKKNKEELLLEHIEEDEIRDSLKQKKRVKEILLEVMKDTPNNYSDSFLINQLIVHTLLLAEYDIELDYTYLKEIMRDVFNRKIVPKSFYQKRDELIQQGFVEDLSDRKPTLHRVRRDKLYDFRNYAINDENFVSNRKMLIPKYRYLVITTRINEILENPTEKDIQALLKIVNNHRKELFYPAELIEKIINKLYKY